jgi:hypothetical protein
MFITYPKVALTGVTAVTVVALVALALALSTSGASANGQGAGGVTGPAFIVDGELYRTVLTPTDLPAAAPDHSFDEIYLLGGPPGAGDQLPVAAAAPGDPDYNGGRWKVLLVTWNTDYATTLAAHDTNGSGDLDSAEEVEAALADASGAGATEEVVRYFACPVIKVPGSHS